MGDDLPFPFPLLPSPPPLYLTHVAFFSHWRLEAHFPLHCHHEYWWGYVPGIPDGVDAYECPGCVRQEQSTESNESTVTNQEVFVKSPGGVVVRVMRSHR